MPGHRPAAWDGTGKQSVQASTSGRRARKPTPTAEVEATDAAKALAAEHGVDLTTVEPSGAGDKIVKDDVAAVVTGYMQEAEGEPEPEPHAETEPQLDIG